MSTVFTDMFSCKSEMTFNAHSIVIIFVVDAGVRETDGLFDKECSLSNNSEGVT